MTWISKVVIVAMSTVICLGILASCASRAVIQSVPLSYNAIKTVVVKSLPGGSRRESDNGRSITSAYFDPETLKPEKKPLKEHAYVVISITGSSRPYDVDVHAFREKQNGEAYEELGEDDKLTDKLAERLRTALADRREDRNVIDDFRAF